MKFTLAFKVTTSLPPVISTDNIYLCISANGTSWTGYKLSFTETGYTKVGEPV